MSEVESPGSLRNLHDLLENGDPSRDGAVAFDLDNTLLDGDCADTWFLTSVERGLFDHRGSRPALTDTYIDLLDRIDESCYWLTHQLEGMSPRQLEDDIRTYVAGCPVPRRVVTGDRQSESIGFSVREETVQLLSLAAGSGWRVIIISATMEVLVAPLVRHLFPDLAGRAEVHGALLETDGPDGRLTGRYAGPLTYAEGKVQRWQARIDPDQPPFLMVGDSSGDLPLLKLSRHRAVVDRGSPVVRAWMDATPGVFRLDPGARGSAA